MEFNTVGLLIEDLNNKRIIELKNHNRDAESVYSYFLSVAKKVEKDGGNYDEVIKAFRKEEKSLREIQKYARNEDEKVKATYELHILSNYLPHIMTEDEIKVQVLHLGTELHPISAKDKGKFMKEIMMRLKGKADGKLVKKCVDNYFNEILN